MRCFLKSHIDGTWEIIEKEYTIPESSPDKWMDMQQMQDWLNNHIMNTLFGALNEKEYSCIKCHTTTHKIWKTLEIFHEGTSHVQENKSIYAQLQYENFIMKKGESISEMNIRFVSIMNDLDVLGEPVPR